MDVKVKIGSRDIVASGSVIVPEEGLDVVLGIADLNFVLKFVQDESQPKLDVKAKSNGEKSLELTFTNVAVNPLGSIWSANVGHLSDRRLHLAVSVHSLMSGKKPSLLTYTFSLGEPTK